MNDKTKGRPKGSPNVSAVVDVQASQCPGCASTRRSEYLDRHVQEYAGTTNAGKKYNRIVRRRTRCLDCGQLRIDRAFEFEPEPPPAAKTEK